jgi:hypothetical protein
LHPNAGKTLETPHVNQTKDDIKREGKKSNFRRNKYEALHSSTAEREMSI